MDHLEEVLTSLRRVIRATDLHSKRLAKISGLTAPQILLLQAMRKLEGAAIRQLANEVSLSQATVTTILDRLEKRGYKAAACSVDFMDTFVTVCRAGGPYVRFLTQALGQVY